MKIINIVDSIQKGNAGIIKAAVSPAEILLKKNHIQSEIWFPECLDRYDEVDFGAAIPISLKRRTVDRIPDLIESQHLDATNTIIVTHGSWQYPTRWGQYFRKLGYKWVYVPHGMLEPWSVSQKRLQKFIYFSLIEYRYLLEADVVRATSSPERKNLVKNFPNVELIPNGIAVVNSADDCTNSPRSRHPKIVLFLARLHHKKGVMPLVRAWRNSLLYENKDFELVIVGYDDGELPKLQKFLNSCSEECNINFIGPVYGVNKITLLKKCTYYILPSYSEGFPMSVLDAMQFGLISIISDGCNFPEAFEEQIAIRISPQEDDILTVLNQLLQIDEEKLKHLSSRSYQFVNQHYSLEKIANIQAELYKKLLS